MGGKLHCQDVAELIEHEGLSPLPEAAGKHLATCADCHSFVADFRSIVTAAQQLPAEVEPPARVWVSLRAQLAAEGLIREEVAVIQPTRRAHWWEAFSGLLQGRALATAAVGLLIFAAGVVQLQRNSPVSPAESAKTQVQEPDALVDSGAALNSQEHELRAAEPAGTLASSSPVDDDLQKNLKTLNAFIAECQHHLKTNPRDQLAREYLAAALQQKAELLAEMMDRGRSVN